MPDYGTIVTIRNLLNRTSGIRDWHDLTEIQGWGEGVSAEGTRDATVTLLPKGDALIVTGENALWWSVKPIYQDTFDGEDYSSWRIAFLRTAEGDIEAMTLPRSRTRALRFERLR
jgi:CubicO group peptidase (beta-lactamase class C family)